MEETSRIYMEQDFHVIIDTVGNTVLPDFLPATRWVCSCLRADGSCSSYRTKREARSVSPAIRVGSRSFLDPGATVEVE